MKILLFSMLILAMSTVAQAVGIQISDRGNFIRIEDAKSGLNNIVYINKGSVLSASLMKAERTYEIRLVTRELIVNGNVAVNKTYSFTFYSAADAERAVEEIIALANPSGH